MATNGEVAGIDKNKKPSAIALDIDEQIVNFRLAPDGDIERNGSYSFVYDANSNLTRIEFVFTKNGVVYTYRRDLTYNANNDILTMSEWQQVV